MQKFNEKKLSGHKMMAGIGLSGTDALNLMKSGWYLLRATAPAGRRMIGYRLVSPGCRSQIEINHSDAEMLINHPVAMLCPMKELEESEFYETYALIELC